MRYLRYAVAAAAVALTAAWVIGPVSEVTGPLSEVIGPIIGKPPVRFVQPRPARTPSLMPDRRGSYASPVRYAYVPACQDDLDPCSHWILVSSDGERGWLPGAADDGSLALSPDGRRAAYLNADERYVVVDLRTGHVTPLPIRQKGGSVGEMFGAQPPLFSLDGRHLLIQLEHLDKDTELVLERPLIVNVRTGAPHRLPAVGEVVGWTSAGLMTKETRRTDDVPGHVTSAAFTVYSPKGKVVRRFALPGNLAAGAVPSPSGRMTATLAREVTPDDVTGLGIVLTGTSTGEPARTVAPRLPAGRRAMRILRWDGEHAVVLRTTGPRGETGHHVVDLATGAARPLDVRMDDVVNLPLQPAALSVVLGSVRQ
ncbi:hypothetical protein GBF35_05635 [Nonomuraea phyllanthi]|uniref:hypothetical protein n=1 Tax=Nonomuraea phyllanthi TaxID=2219224 RepID=UPI0012936883|nr:hypothetical protein [Nonomuraea phyllanthi]QFY06225.1 hypothetical protein GBF35_05635 [Nonomuraea phyllanthi]